MAEVDLSSYPKPQAPTNFLDTAQKYQGLESNKLTIDKQKLDLVNNQFGLMNKELSTLIAEPNTTKEQAAQRLTTFANTYNFPAQVTSHMISELQNSPDVKTFAQRALTRSQTTQEAINYHYGVKSPVETEQQIIPGVFSPKPGMGQRATGLPIQKQPPVTQEIVDNDENSPTYGQKKTLGPMAPVAAPGTVVAPPMAPGFGGGLPVRRVPTESINPSQPTPAQVIQNRSGGLPTSLPPGVGEAETQAGAASGAQLARMREQSANYQRDLFPLTQAIPALEKLGTKGTGPGTETLNHLKSFVLSNVPGVKESDFGLGNVKDYDKAKKYLTDFVNQTGNSGTNDKLAAAFAGNPSVSISNAAAVDVAKSAVALRKMQQAIYLDAEHQGIPASKISRWVAKRTNEIDPRAFGTNIMTPEAKKKLKEQLDKNPAEKSRFENSAQIAQQYGLLN